MPSKPQEDNYHPATPSYQQESVVVEAHHGQHNATTSPLTSSLGGTPTRTTVGELTPEYPFVRAAGVMSQYPPPPPPHQQSQGHSSSQAPPAGAPVGRDGRYAVQMISTGHPPPPHYQGQVTYHLPPNIPQLYGAPPASGSSGGNNNSGSGPPQYANYPPHSQHHHQQQPPPQGASPSGQHTYVIAGYPPPGSGHPPPPPNSSSGGSQYVAVNYGPPPPGGAYYSHHHPSSARPPSPHHRSSSHPGSSAPSSGGGGAPVYVHHGGRPPPGTSSYPVIYSQQPPSTGQLRGGPPPAHHQHPSTVSKSSTHPSEVEHQATDSLKPPREALPTMEEIQAQRESEERAMEQLLKNVKPIQSDYHLFVEAEKDNHMEAATTDAGGDDPYLRNSNLNYRLKAAWENSEPSERAIYFKKEELDRKRFMEEEEVASRHCATLTARNTPTSSSSNARKKSPTPTGTQVTVEGESAAAEDARDEDANKRTLDQPGDDSVESPLKKERLEHMMDSAAVETAAAAESVEVEAV